MLLDTSLPPLPTHVCLQEAQLLAQGLLCSSTSAEPEPHGGSCCHTKPPLLQASACTLQLISTHVLPAAVVGLILAGISKSCREVAFIKYCPRCISEEMFRKKEGKRKPSLQEPSLLYQTWRFSGRIFKGLFSFLS